MLLKDVIGQQEVKERLVELVNQNRLSHALLFLSKDGCGALPLAISFAAYICCEKVQNSLLGEEGGLFEVEKTVLHDACGVCASCIKSAKLIHPDIHFSYPVITRKPGEKPKSTDFISEWREFIQNYPYGNAYDWLQLIQAENKQGNITAEECNDIIRKLSLKSFESVYKVLVLWMPEFLGKEGNKLLKLIEEPPPNTLFIFVAENEEMILPTILSRLQLIKIPLLPDEEIAERLKEKSGLSNDQAIAIAGIAEGNFRQALQLIQHADDDWQQQVEEWFRCILKSGPQAQLKWIEEMSAAGREKQKQFLVFFNHILEQCIRLRIMPEAVKLSEKNLDLSKRINKVCSISQQQAMIEETDKAVYFIERNANAKMLFHALTIKLMHIIKNNALILTS